MGDEEQQPRRREDLLTLAQATRYVAEKRLAEQDWSGLPLPVLGLRLVLEPRYKHKDIANFRWPEWFDEDGIGHKVAEEQAPEPSEFKFVNSWWSPKYQATFSIWKDTHGRARVTASLEDRLLFSLRTLEAAAAWPVGAEHRAQKKLRSLISGHMFEQYELTGHFSEVSKRSQVTYIFRRGRPTLALREVDDGLYGLCALCLHPIGYYAETWAGVMCPTDEVIAHLLMMRGSEEKFWANANQHPLDHPNAGV